MFPYFTELSLERNVRKDCVVVGEEILAVHIVDNVIFVVIEFVVSYNVVDWGRVIGRADELVEGAVSGRNCAFFFRRKQTAVEQELVLGGSGVVIEVTGKNCGQTVKLVNDIVYLVNNDLRLLFLNYIVLSCVYVSVEVNVTLTRVNDLKYTVHGKTLRNTLGVARRAPEL